MNEYPCSDCIFNQISLKYFKTNHIFLNEYPCNNCVLIQISLKYFLKQVHVLRKGKYIKMSRHAWMIHEEHSFQKIWQARKSRSMSSETGLGCIDDNDISLRKICRSSATGWQLRGWTGNWSICMSCWTVSNLWELHQPRLWFITGGYLVKR